MKNHSPVCGLMCGRPRRSGKAQSSAWWLHSLVGQHALTSFVIVCSSTCSAQLPAKKHNLASPARAQHSFQQGSTTLPAKFSAMAPKRRFCCPGGPDVSASYRHGRASGKSCSQPSGAHTESTSIHIKFNTEGCKEGSGGPLLGSGCQ
mgnify:CR=1 FL=1